MISSKIVEVLGDTRYKWNIKLEAKGTTIFAKEFPFEGTFPQAQMQGDIAAGLSQVRIGRVLLERGEEINNKEGLTTPIS